MKLYVFAAVCLASCLGLKQTEVVTQNGSYFEDETIVTDTVRQREVHRSKITHGDGRVTQHVVVKLFTKGVFVSYSSSNDSLCLVAPLQPGDSPVPPEAFRKVSAHQRSKVAVTAEITDHDSVEVSAVDVTTAEVPYEARAICGQRNVTLLRVSPPAAAEGTRVKRGYYGKRKCSVLQFIKKCTFNQHRYCCKYSYHYHKYCKLYCVKVVPYCYHSYHYVYKYCY